MNIREKAELHWKYTEELIRKSAKTNQCNISKIDESWIDLCHYLYVEAMCHGYKHKEDELRSLTFQVSDDTICGDKPHIFNYCWRDNK